MSKQTDEGVEMRDEYDFSAGVRGAFADRYRKGAHVTIVDADVAKVFPDSISVNKGLRMLIRLDAQGLLNIEKTLQDS